MEQRPPLQLPVNRKFTGAEAQRIRQRRSAGERVGRLAVEYGCCRHTIQRLCKGAYYREVES